MENLNTIPNTQPVEPQGFSTKKIINYAIIGIALLILFPIIINFLFPKKPCGCHDKNPDGTPKEDGDFIKVSKKDLDFNMQKQYQRGVEFGKAEILDDFNETAEIVKPKINKRKTAENE